MSSNVEMVELWNGEAAAAWATSPDRYDRMLAPFGDRVLAAAQLQPGEHVLDVGCGAGALSVAAAREVGDEGEVTGADIARPLLEVASERAGAAALRNVRFTEADVQSAELPGAPFDAILSRFGVMFFADPVGAFANLRRHASPGGRLAFVCWQPLGENEWALDPVLAVMAHLGVPDAPPPDAPGPFAFGDPDRIRSVLTASGWDVTSIEGHDEQINVGGASTAEEAVAYFREDLFGKMLFARAAQAEAEAAAEALRAAFAKHVRTDGVRMKSSTWLVAARAVESDAAEFGRRR